MYHTILVPLDGSKRAENILPHAASLAKSYGARVILLHVIEPIHLLGNEPATDVVEQTMLEELEQGARDYFHQWQWKFRTQGIVVETRIEIGPPVKTIIAVAEQVNADLIAIANQGQTGLSRVFYGSVASGVLNQIDRPLLIIRSDATDLR